MTGIEKLEKASNEIKEILNDIRKHLPVQHSHHFDLKTKGWIIVGVLLLIVTAITTGLSAHLWVSNDHLQETSIKYRMIKQVYPDVGLWADTTYLHDPGLAEKATSKLEYEQVAEKENGKIIKKHRRSNHSK